MACLFNILAMLTILLSAVIIPPLIAFQFIYAAAVIIPELGIAVRRLRDAGKAWYNIFWPFLPVIGTIILIVLLCRRSNPSIAAAETPVV